MSRWVSCLVSLLFAASGLADVALVVRPVEGDLCADTGTVTVEIHAENTGREVIASYALRIHLEAGRVAYVPGSIRDGSGGFGTAPVVNVVDHEIRLSGANPNSVLVSGSLCLLNLAVRAPIGDRELLWVEDYGPDALISAEYTRIPHYYDLTRVVRPCDLPSPPATAIVSERESSHTPTVTPTPTVRPREPSLDPTNALPDTDTNGDCRTNVVDLALVIDHLHRTLSPWTGTGCNADVDRDGEVDFGDLSWVMRSIGTSRGDCGLVPPMVREPLVLYTYRTGSRTDGTVETVVELLDATALRGFQLTLTYDPRSLEFVQVTAGESLDPEGEEVTLSATVEEPGAVHIAVVRATPDAVRVDSTLARFLFRPRSAVFTPAALSEAVLVDDTLTVLPVIFE